MARKLMTRNVSIFVAWCFTLIACPYDASEANTTQASDQSTAARATGKSDSAESTAAAGSTGSTPRKNVKRVPPDDVLCKLFIGNVSNDIYEFSDGCCYEEVLGTHINDVKTVLGEPFARPQDDTWVYLWCTGDRCQTDAKATLHFEFAPRCKLDTGENVTPPYWLHGIKVEGFDFRTCWDGPKRKSLRAPCDECLNLAGVDECSNVKRSKP
jgi:hypothetical protein